MRPLDVPASRLRSGRLLPAPRPLARLAALLALLLGPVPALAQEGALAGTVVDAESLRPVAGAQISIAGTGIGTLSDAEGLYRLRGIPAGPARVAVRLIGYREVARDVTVAAGKLTSLEFRLEQTALQLQDIVVTGLVGEMPRIKLPFTVERIDPADMPVPASNASTLLVGKAAGVTIAGASGQPGQTADILLRGPTSINNRGRHQGPLIVIDGIIQSQSATLADINTLDIDHIEIVKGPAASSLYGSRAQAGVIQIATKRGTAVPVDRAEFVFRSEVGNSWLAGREEFSLHHPFKMNEARTKFIDSFGNEVDYQEFNRFGNGGPVFQTGDPETSFRDMPYPGEPFDHLAQFFEPGETVSIYGAAAGRTPEWAYRVSGEWYRETGIVDCGEACLNPVALENFGEDYAVRDDGFERWNGRISVDGRLGDAELSVSAFLSRSSQDQSSVVDNPFVPLAKANPFVDLTQPGPDGRPDNAVDPANPWGNPLYWIAVNDASEQRRRVMGSADLRLPITDWLSLEGNVSYDRTDFETDWLVPKDQVFCCEVDPVESGGLLRLQNVSEEATNGSLTASLAHRFLDGDLVTRAKLRVLGESQSFDTNGGEGNNFSVKDVPTFDALEGSFEANNELRDIRSLAYFAIVGADYRGRYILDGLIRRDGSSLFGPSDRWHTYLRGSAAWRVSQEPFWDVGWIDELKLRFSVGTAGGRPNFFSQYETYEVGGGAIFPRRLGNRVLRPEFSIEREAGVQLVLFDALGLDLTYAWRTTDDQLLVVPQLAVGGFESRWENAGEIKARTWEASLRWSAIEREDVGLSFRFNWDRSTTRITRLDVPEYSSSGFWHAEGEVMGSLWGARFASDCADVARAIGLFTTEGIDCSQFQVNDGGYMVYVGEGHDWTDGISGELWGTRGEVAGHEFRWGMPIQTQEQNRTCLARHPEDRGIGERCPLSKRVPVGSTEPDFNAALATQFRYRGLAVSVLFDATLGFDLFHRTRREGQPPADRSQVGKPDGLEKPVAYYQVLGSLAVGHLQREFLEPGGWVKLRELAVGYTLPDSFTRSFLGGAIDRLTLSAIGRNLLTFTKFTGFDPEVGVSTSSVGSAAIDRWEQFQYPPSRTVSLALEVVF